MRLRLTCPEDVERTFAVEMLLHAANAPVSEFEQEVVDILVGPSVSQCGRSRSFNGHFVAFRDRSENIEGYGPRKNMRNVRHHFLVAVPVFGANGRTPDLEIVRNQLFVQSAMVSKYFMAIFRLNSTDIVRDPARFAVCGKLSKKVRGKASEGIVSRKEAGGAAGDHE